jgi:hypothetical protein
LRAESDFRSTDHRENLKESQASVSIGAPAQRARVFLSLSQKFQKKKSPCAFTLSAAIA